MFADTSATLDDTPRRSRALPATRIPQSYSCANYRFACVSPGLGSVTGELCYFTGQRLSISFRISSAQRSPSPIALTVAGTLVPPSYWASLRAARIDAAMSSTRLRPSSIPGSLPHSPIVRLLHAPRAVAGSREAVVIRQARLTDTAGKRCQRVASYMKEWHKA
jgi:hypothetical protein